MSFWGGGGGGSIKHQRPSIDYGTEEGSVSPLTADHGLIVSHLDTVHAHRPTRLSSTINQVGDCLKIFIF